MTAHLQKKILAALTPDGFVGRGRELDALLAHARATDAGGMRVLSPPGAGVSELLRQTYDRLFIDASADVIPFYFEVRRSDGDAASAGRRFARTFLAQAIAYQRADSSLINSPLEVSELLEIARPSDGTWVRQLAGLCESEPLSLRACLSGPSRALANGVRVFTIIDALEETSFLENGGQFLNELRDAFAESGIGFVFSSRRGFRSASDPARTINLGRLSIAEAGNLIEIQSGRCGVPTNDQTRDLLAVQLKGNAARICAVFAEAAEKSRRLDSFRNASSQYTDTLLSGQIGMAFDAVIDTAAADSATRIRLIEFLRDTLSSSTKIPIDSWRSAFSIPDDRFDGMIDVLNVEEIIQIESGVITVDSGDVVNADCIETRFLLEIESRTRSAVKAGLVTESLKRSPGLMARFYRRSSSLGISQVLSRFDCQEVPAALFDFGKFRDLYKGRTHREIVTSLTSDKIRRTLPQIVFVDSAASFFPPIADGIEDERAAVGTGFVESKYTDADQTAWLVAEIDSKLEAGPEIVREWCDRLELVAEESRLRGRQIWLITPEGFTPEALDLLRERGAFGSSRQQAILLNRFLSPAQSFDEPAGSDEYEIVVPMGEDTELIAAHAVEEVARRHHFPQKAINQIKTALVEACINAVEHSLSPDRKIYQKFAVDSDKIDITVSNRGLRLMEIAGAETAPMSGRRGWGLSLIKGLMDEVWIEQVDDGTRIRMTKYLKAREN